MSGTCHEIAATWLKSSIPVVFELLQLLECQRGNQSNAQQPHNQAVVRVRARGIPKATRSRQ